MADAPGLLDPVGLAVILDVPVGTVDGWRFTGRGPRWARVGGVVRYRTDDIRAWLLEEREVQAKRTDQRFRRIDYDAALERLDASAPLADAHLGSRHGGTFRGWFPHPSLHQTLHQTLWVRPGSL